MKPFYYAMLAVIFWGSAPVFEKIGLAALPPAAGIFIRSLIAAAGTAVIFSFNKPGWEVFSVASPKALIFLAIAGLNSALIGQFFYFKALKLGEASMIVPLCSTYPFVAVALSILILNESLTVNKIFGICLILAGIWLLKG
ncbi:MAG TPA: EamA family transporter [bacterium]